MPTIDEVWHTEAGARLFNAIGEMNLINKNGGTALFSERLRLTKHVIGLMLEAGYVPENMRPLSSVD